MRKLLIITTFVLAITGCATAQGVLQWLAVIPVGYTDETNTVGPSPFTGVDDPVGTIGPTTTTPNSFYFELLYNPAATQQATPTTLSALDAWMDTGLAAVNSTVTAGRVAVLNPSAAATVPFTAATSLMLVGWSANLGTNWTAALGALNSPAVLTSVLGTAFFGMSSTGFITPYSAGFPLGAPIFGTMPGEINSMNTQLFVVNPIPEPTTIAMGVMGGLSLLVLRRKKA